VTTELKTEERRGNLLYTICIHSTTTALNGRSV